MAQEQAYEVRVGWIAEGLALGKLAIGHGVVVARGYEAYHGVLGLRCLYHHAAHALATVMRKKFGARVMGPVSAALEMLRGEHRAEILLKIESGASMQRARTLLREAIATVEGDPQYKTVKISVDVDAL